MTINWWCFAQTKSLCLVLSKCCFFSISFSLFAFLTLFRLLTLNDCFIEVGKMLLALLSTIIACLTVKLGLFL